MVNKPILTMKVLSLICLLFFISCRPENKQAVVKEYKFDILFYPQSNKDYSFNEVIDVSHLDGDSSVYIYDYKSSKVQLKEKPDTLVIKQDSVWFNNDMATFLKEKRFPFKQNSVMVKKYYHSGTFNFNNLYMVDSLGLLFGRFSSHPSGMTIVRYNSTYTGELFETISKDSIFFNFESDW